MGSNHLAPQRSPELMLENSCSPSGQQKEVVLFEWWLMKAGKAYNGSRLIIGGFTRRGEGVGIFRSAPIIKRYDHCTLGTVDGITLRIQGPINRSRTIDNGFSLEASNAFLFGFPTTWDNFTESSSQNKPSDSKMLEQQLENTFDPSFQQKTVLLRNWWLRNAEKVSDGNRLAVGGFTECGKAMRLFDSSPIIKRHDAYTLETADGITIRIEGFINKIRTLDNGFPLEVCRTFLIGFPTTWTDFANGSSWDKSLHVEIPVSASRSAERSKDSLENVPFGFPVKLEGSILHNVPSTFSTSVCDSDKRLKEAIHKFTALVSMCNPARMPLVDRGSHHLPEKSFCDNNQLQDGESCEANMRDAHSNNQLQDDGSCGTNLRDPLTGYPDNEAGHTPVDKDSESHDLKEGTTQKKDEKFDECSTRRPEEVRQGLPKLENLHGEDYKYAKFTAKPVRRSLRLKSLNPENVHVECQYKSGVLSEENHDVHQQSINTCFGVTSNSNAASKYGCYDDSASTASSGKSLNDKTTFSSDCVAGLTEVTPSNSKAATSQTAEKRILRCSGKREDNQTPISITKVEQNDSRKQSSGTNFKEKTSLSSASFSRRKAKNVEVSTVRQQAEDKASHKMGCKTVWTSSYTNVHCRPFTRYKKNKSTILTPESLNLKRSRSGRLLIPRLDCSMRVVYEPDGSFVRTATVDLSCAASASVVMPTSSSKGKGAKLDRKKRKKQR